MAAVLPPPRERRSLWSTVRDASAAPPTINDVVMLGKSKPRDFSLGGKHGNIVIASSDSRVHKGWRLVSIDGQETGLVGPPQIATMLSQAARKGKHTLSFAGEKPTGGGGIAVAPMVRRTVAASGLQRSGTPHDAEKERSAAAAEAARREAAAAEQHRAAVEQAKRAARERREADELAKQAEEAQRAERRARELAGRRKEEEERAAREEREARGQAARATPSGGARASERPTERGSAARDGFHSLPSRTAVANPQQTLLLALTSPAAAAASAAPKAGPCDKCDGDHHADVCPHFRKERDKHRDAWAQYGKGGEAGEAGQGAVVVRGARVVRQPGDGACLFHSLAHGVGSSAASLRAQLASFVEESPDAEIAGAPLRDWVLWECGLAPAQYARRMRGAGQWGGAIELAIFSHVHKVAVCVYEPEPGGGHRRISVFGRLPSPKALHLLYGGRVHYDALVLPAGDV